MHYYITISDVLFQKCTPLKTSIHLQDSSQLRFPTSSRIVKFVKNITIKIMTISKQDYIKNRNNRSRNTTGRKGKPDKRRENFK
eukprot:TRINITY_DN5365_c0_g1_i1.p1 TRINITY_DN5365_c0_g1~~TRINITY_DN5365_c0_g1_i1.p1  ORF type:complete len:84 (-),score=4.11 TRINITY_DN5365_c0_g1_i1:173-424(-)